MIGPCWRKCGRPTVVLVARVKLAEQRWIEQPTMLCSTCRSQAARENAEALSRRTISTNITAYRRMGYRGDLPPNIDTWED